MASADFCASSSRLISDAAFWSRCIRSPTPSSSLKCFAADMRDPNRFMEAAAWITASVMQLRALTRCIATSCGPSLSLFYAKRNILAFAHCADLNDILFTADESLCNIGIPRGDEELKSDVATPVPYRPDGNSTSAWRYTRCASWLTAFQQASTARSA